MVASRTYSILQISYIPFQIAQKRFLVGKKLVTSFVQMIGERRIFFHHKRLLTTPKKLLLTLFFLDRTRYTDISSKFPMKALPIIFT